MFAGGRGAGGGGGGGGGMGAVRVQLDVVAYQVRLDLLKPYVAELERSCGKLLYCITVPTDRISLNLCLSFKYFISFHSLQSWKNYVKQKESI